MTDQHGLITEDGRIIFYVHHLSEENRQKVANVKAVYEENERLKARIAELEVTDKISAPRKPREVWVSALSLEQELLVHLASRSRSTLKKPVLFREVMEDDE